jgi:hypothetical protein
MENARNHIIVILILFIASLNSHGLYSQVITEKNPLIDITPIGEL